VVSDSIFALVNDGDSHSYHFALCQRQIAVTVHQAIIEGHERSQSRRIQAVDLDDIVNATPGSAGATIESGDDPGRFFFADGPDPGHDQLSSFGRYSEG